MKWRLGDGTDIVVSVYSPTQLRLCICTSDGRTSVTHIDNIVKKLRIRKGVALSDVSIDLNLFELTPASFVIVCSRSSNPKMFLQYSACWYIQINSSTDPLLFTLQSLSLPNFYKFDTWMRTIVSFGEDDEYLVYILYDTTTLCHVLYCCKRVEKIHAWTAEIFSPPSDEKKIDLFVPDYMEVRDNVIVRIDEKDIVARPDGLEFTGELPSKSFWRTPDGENRRDGLDTPVRVKCALPPV